MSKKKKQKTPYSDKSEFKFIKGTPEDIFPALVDNCCDAVMERIMPALEKTFDEQNAYIQKLIGDSLDKAYKTILQHSIEERKETLDGMTKEDDDDNEG
tara:strand:+ start:107 stop:403 length:297 start_codon:yes stop_codon:yes gene_type:complete